MAIQTPILTIRFYGPKIDGNYYIVSNDQKPEVDMSDYTCGFVLGLRPIRLK